MLSVISRPSTIQYEALAAVDIAAQPPVVRIRAMFAVLAGLTLPFGSDAAPDDCSVIGFEAVQLLAGRVKGLDAGVSHVAPACNMTTSPH